MKSHCLYIAEDDGEVDADFPGLDFVLEVITMMLFAFSKEQLQSFLILE